MAQGLGGLWLFVQLVGHMLCKAHRSDPFRGFEKHELKTGKSESETTSGFL